MSDKYLVSLIDSSTSSTDEASWCAIFLEYSEHRISKAIAKSSFLRYQSEDNYLSVVCSNRRTGEVIGFINATISFTSFGKKSAYIEDFFVVQGFRGTKCALLLLQSTELKLKECGVQVIEGKTSKNNALANSIYQKIATPTNWRLYEKNI